jgi:hypothetical protein
MFQVSRVRPESLLASEGYLMEFVCNVESIEEANVIADVLAQATSDSMTCASMQTSA